MAKEALNNRSTEPQNKHMDGGMCQANEFVLASTMDFLDWNEKQMTKELQEEIFAPERVYSSLEAECMANTMLYEVYFEDFILRLQNWLYEILPDGCPRYKSLKVVKSCNWEEIYVNDRVMLQMGKNPLLTNMDVAEQIPQKPWQIKVEETEQDRLFNAEAQDNDFHPYLQNFYSEML